VVRVQEVVVHDVAVARNSETVLILLLSHQMALLPLLPKEVLQLLRLPAQLLREVLQLLLLPAQLLLQLLLLLLPQSQNASLTMF